MWDVRNASIQDLGQFTNSMYEKDQIFITQRKWLFAHKGCLRCSKKMAILIPKQQISTNDATSNQKKMAVCIQRLLLDVSERCNILPKENGIDSKTTNFNKYKCCVGYRLLLIVAGDN